MIRYRQLEHRFVDDIPEPFDSGVLYVSIRYATAVHLCCCGCGREVVTPFSPAQWHLTFDGETVSLHPSIGSWNLPCRSHYVIRNGRVIQAPSMVGQRSCARAGERQACKGSALRIQGGGRSRDRSCETASTATRQRLARFDWRLLHGTSRALIQYCLGRGLRWITLSGERSAAKHVILPA